jgi:ankyrin repeat protein
MQEMRTQFRALLLCLVVFQGCVEQPEAKLRPEAAKKLLKLRGYEFDEKGFHEAARTRDTTAIVAFLDGGMNINAQCESDGRTALISASARGDLEVSSFLIQRGADVNIQDKQGYTALLHAIEARYEDVEKILLDHPNLDPHARGLNGITALGSYVWRERTDAVKKLLERGANVNAQDNDGDAPLHGAAQNGNVELIDLLIDKGADPNLKNKLGGTPLMWAAVYGHEDAARWLIEHGADPSLKDNDGMTARDWAIKNKRDKLVALLQRAR